MKKVIAIILVTYLTCFVLLTVPAQTSDTKVNLPVPAKISKNLGFKYLSEAKYSKAEKNFRKVLEDQPADPVSHYGLALLYSNKEYRYHDFFMANFFLKKTGRILDQVKFSDRKREEIQSVIKENTLDSLNNIIDYKTFNYIKTQKQIRLVDKYLSEFPETGYRDKTIEHKKWLIFEDVLRKNTFKEYNKYIKEYPETRYVSTAVKKRDSIAYSNVRKKNTIDAFKQFVTTYPKSKQYNDALALLKVKQAYENAKTNNTIEAYRQFIEEYPETPEADMAEKNIEEVVASAEALFKSKYNSYYNDVARYLAAINQGKESSLSNITSGSIWQKHKKNFQTFNATFGKTRIPKMRSFANAELSEVNENIKTLFYPFSGPDFIHADIFFPSAKKIIMLGLERVGSIPDIDELSEKQLGTFFDAIKISLDSLMTFGYFMTNDMRRDFARSLELRGVLPVILIFMAQTDYWILDVKKKTLNNYGQVIPSDPSKDKDDPFDTYISGAEIKYVKKNEGKIRYLYYFSHDVSDKSLYNTPGFLRFIESQDIDATFMKAASYLCTHFTSVRNIAVKNSKYVFQTDSGIPYKYFDKKSWDFNFYGKYTRPISVFWYCNQPDLRWIFSNGKNVKPLDFGIGYGIRINESNLMLAKRKNIN